MEMKKVHAAAVAAKKKAQPVFDKSEHAAAVSYAVVEFVHVHELVVIASALLLVAFGVILVGRGLEAILAQVANGVTTLEGSL